MSPQLNHQELMSPTLHPQMITQRAPLLKIHGYHWLQYPRIPEVPKDTHPLHQRTGQCHHIPPSLPARPSSNAAGSATRALQGFGMVNGACGEREEQGHSYEPSPIDPIKSPERPGHQQILLSGQSPSSCFIFFNVKKKEPNSHSSKEINDMIVYK